MQRYTIGQHHQPRCSNNIERANGSGMSNNDRILHDDNTLGTGGTSSNGQRQKDVLHARQRPINEDTDAR